MNTLASLAMASIRLWRRTEGEGLLCDSGDVWEESGPALPNTEARWRPSRSLGLVALCRQGVRLGQFFAINSDVCPRGQKLEVGA